MGASAAYVAVSRVLRKVFSPTGHLRALAVVSVGAVAAVHQSQALFALFVVCAARSFSTVVCSCDLTNDAAGARKLCDCESLSRHSFEPDSHLGLRCLLHGMNLLRFTLEDLMLKLFFPFVS